VYRLVIDKPERLSMKVLNALCDILDCTPADPVDPYTESAAYRRTAGEPAAAAMELKPARGRNGPASSTRNNAPGCRVLSRRGPVRALW
jgi:hypothetical protein